MSSWTALTMHLGMKTKLDQIYKKNANMLKMQNYTKMHINIGAEKQ